MPTTKEQRIQLDKCNYAVTVGEGLTLLKNYSMEYHCSRQIGELQRISDDYDLMMQYMQLGFKDDKREELYMSLQSRLFTVYSELLRQNVKIDNITYAQASLHADKQVVDYSEIGNRLDSFNQNIALASLAEDAETKQKTIIDEQHEYRKLLFDTLFTFEPFNEGQVESLRNVLLSPLTDDIDSSLIISALMLALQTVFDPLKLRLLCEVYSKSENKIVQVRTMVAIVLSMPNEYQIRHVNHQFKKAFAAMFSADGTKSDFFAVIYQMLMCLSTQQAEKVMRNEIIPTLSKNARHMNMNDLDGSDLDDILHPDREEKEMDEMENTVKRVRDMSKNGLDIFYSGFSHSKRYSFFYTLMNWFYPFTINHPQLDLTRLKGLSKQALDTLLGQQVFCSSDKYSFALTINGLAVNLPQSMVDMINEKVTNVPDIKELNDKKAIIREYMQDLYRFYKLYPNFTNFRNPFTDNDLLEILSCPLFSEIFTDDDNYKIVRLLMKNKLFNQAEKILCNVKDITGVKFMKTAGLVQMKLEDFEKAGEYFSRAYEMDSEDLKLLLLAGKAYCNEPQYNKAVDMFSRYAELSSDMPDECRYLYALALYTTENIDEALKHLFQLYFEHDDNDEYKALIAYCYLSQGRFDDAMNMADKMSGDADNEIRNAVVHALAKIACGDMKGGIETLTHCLHDDEAKLLTLRELSMQKDILEQLKLSDAEIKIIIDMASAKKQK